MKVKIGHYMHRENGIYLEIVPETQHEQDLLRAMWKHGEMATSASAEASHLSGNACIIRAFSAKSEVQK